MARSDFGNLSQAMGLTATESQAKIDKEKREFIESPKNQQAAFDTLVQQEWAHLNQWFSHHIAERTLPFAPMDGRQHTVYPPFRAALAPPAMLAADPFAYLTFIPDPTKHTTHGFLMFDIDMIRIARVPTQGTHGFLTMAELHFKLTNLTVQITHSKTTSTDTIGITFLTDTDRPISVFAVLKTIALYNYLPELLALLQDAWYAKIDVLLKHHPEDLQKLKAAFRLTAANHRQLTLQDIQNDTAKLTPLRARASADAFAAFQRYNSKTVLKNGAQYLAKDKSLPDWIQATLLAHFPTGNVRAPMPSPSRTQPLSSLFTHIQRVKLTRNDEHDHELTFKITHPTAPATVKCSYDPLWAYWSADKRRFAADMKSYIQQRWFRLSLRDINPAANVRLSGMMSYYLSNINDRPALSVGFLMDKRPTPVSFAYMNEDYFRTLIDVVQTTLAERREIAFDFPAAIQANPAFNSEANRFLLYPRSALQVRIDYTIHYLLEQVAFSYKKVSLSKVSYEGTRDGEPITSRGSPVLVASPTLTEDTLDPADFGYNVYAFIDHLTKDENLRIKLKAADPRDFIAGDYANLRTLIRAHYGYEWDDYKYEFLFIYRLYQHLKHTVPAPAQTPRHILSPKTPTVKNEILFTDALGYGETIQIRTRDTYSQLDASRHLVYRDGNNITVQLTLKTPNTTAFIQRWFQYEESHPNSLMSKLMNLVYTLTKNDTFGARLSIQLNVKTE